MIMNALVERLRTSLEGLADHRDIFRSYKEAVHRYLSARGSDSITEDERYTAVQENFLNDYRALAQDYTIVLTIDTFEKLDPEIKEVEPFNFRRASRLESWLIELVNELPHTLTILAGRQRPKQAELLAEKLGPKLQTFLIEPFDAAETREYVTAEGGLSEADTQDPEKMEALYRISGGVPIILIVAVACMRLEAFDPAALPPHLERPHTEGRQTLDQAFMDVVMGDLHTKQPALADLLTKAAYLRKGLTFELLRHISQAEGDVVDEETLREQLSSLRKLPIVKLTGDETMILHDEIYDLFGRSSKLGAKNEAAWYTAAVDYLSGKLGEVMQQLQHVQEKERRLELIQDSQALQVERLFYRMAREPLEGYQDYRELCLSTILAQDQDFDTQLQDELARFYDQDTEWGRNYLRRLEKTQYSWSQICYDESVHWVYRCLNTHVYGLRQRYHEALTLAELVKQTYPGIYEDDDLARAALDVAHLEAEIFTSDAEQPLEDIATRFERVIEQLEQLEQHADTSSSTSVHVKRLYNKFILAIGYNNWGSLERTLQHYRKSTEKYIKAGHLYEELGEETDNLRGNMLNNLGYVLMLQGEPELGRFISESALSLFEKRGVSFRVAVTLNTLARIHMERDDLTAALDCVLRARGVLEEFGSQRNLAACAFIEAEIRRRIAYQNSHHKQQSEKEYLRAIRRYEEAQQMFDKQVELRRRIEVRQGLGCAYRSRGFARLKRGEDASSDMQQALEYFDNALDLQDKDSEGPSPLRTSILEDIAVVYVNQDRCQEAFEALNRARRSIREAYTIKEGIGAAETPETREQQIYWLQLGQLEVQEALCYFMQHNYEDSCKAFVRAFACVLTFSPRAKQLARFRELARVRLARIKDPAVLQTLRCNVYTYASRLRLHDAFRELDQLFDEAIVYASILFTP
jgi:tetratricopeptide (TPR) repeat protein